MLLSWHHDRPGLYADYPNLEPAFKQTLKLSNVAKVFEVNDSL